MGKGWRLGVALFAYNAAVVIGGSLRGAPLRTVGLTCLMVSVSMVSGWLAAVWEEE